MGKTLDKEQLLSLCPWDSPSHGAFVAPLSSGWCDKAVFSIWSNQMLSSRAVVCSAGLCNTAVAGECTCAGSRACWGSSPRGVREIQ